MALLFVRFKKGINRGRLLASGLSEAVRSPKGDNMRWTQHGFTLVELMIVVAIIGILAAIAIPAYQNNVAKSKAAAALSDIRGGQTAYELLAVEGATQTVAKIGLQPATGNCAVITVSATATPGADTAAAIKCTIANPGPIGAAGTATIQLDRDKSGFYRCVTTGFSDATFRPAGCS